MHEMSIVAGVLDAVSESAAQAGATRVLSISLSIGDMTQVVDEALEFAFEALTEGTICEGAELVVNKVHPRSVCLECGGEFHHKLNSGEMSMEDCAGISDSMSAVVWRTPGLQVYRENIVLEDSLAHGEVIHMEDDVLTCDGREIAAFHFILAKVPNYFRYVEMPRRRAGRFWIDKTGFYYGQFAWSTRVIRRPWRMSVAALSSLHRHGLRHVLTRLGV